MCRSFLKRALAKSCLSSDDILQEYQMILPEKCIGGEECSSSSFISSNIWFVQNSGSETEKSILSVLEKEHFLSLEEILEYTSLDSNEVLGTLSLLEISGTLLQTHGKYHKQ